LTERFVMDLTTDFLEPLSPWGSPYTASRLAVLPDRSTIPVLRLLALKKFGSWAADEFPFWIDGDPSNETLENVALARRERATHRKLGIPSGPDYRAKWNAANRERVRRYVREAQARRVLRLTLGTAS